MRVLTMRVLTKCVLTVISRIVSIKIVSVLIIGGRMMRVRRIEVPGRALAWSEMVRTPRSQFLFSLLYHPPMALTAVPITLTEAREFVGNFHRHNKPPVGGVFAVGVSDGTRLVGVAIAGRPVARMLDNGETLEVTRCCVLDDAPKGSCSFLYARCWNAARALGWKRILTYTLQAESGASLRGAGWKVIAQTDGYNPAAWQSRPGREWQAVVGQAKFRWEAAA
jgi:hypothetical protein